MNSSIAFERIAGVDAPPTEMKPLASSPAPSSSTLASCAVSVEIRPLKPSSRAERISSGALAGATPESTSRSGFSLTIGVSTGVKSRVSLA